MKTRYKYIHFEEGPNPGRSTRRFLCRNTESRLILGEVKWERGWRQYCFSPMGCTVFSKGCLEDVNDFIGQLMDERKK